MIDKDILPRRMSTLEPPPIPLRHSALMPWIIYGLAAGLFWAVVIISTSWELGVWSVE